MLDTVLSVYVPFKFGVLAMGRMLNSIVSVPAHCRFVYLGVVRQTFTST